MNNNRGSGADNERDMNDVARVLSEGLLRIAAEVSSQRGDSGSQSGQIFRMEGLATPSSQGVGVTTGSLPLRDQDAVSTLVQRLAQGMQTSAAQGGPPQPSGLSQPNTGVALSTPSSTLDVNQLVAMIQLVAALSANSSLIAENTNQSLELLRQLQVASHHAQLASVHQQNIQLLNHLRTVQNGLVSGSSEIVPNPVRPPNSQAITTADFMKELRQNIVPVSFQAQHFQPANIGTQANPGNVDSRPSNSTAPQNNRIPVENVATRCPELATFPQNIHPGDATILGSPESRHALLSSPIYRQIPVQLRMEGYEPFPKKLYRILEDAERHGQETIISWMPSGKSLRIHDPDTFMKEIAPLHFRHSKYTSFMRQLQMYDFVRAAEGAYIDCYAHRDFQKGKPELLSNLRRVQVKLKRPPKSEAGDENAD